jgi:acyl carrier protein
MGSVAADSAQHEALFQEVHKTLVDVLIDVVGEEFYEECEIGLDSTFAEDIELESTEILAIAEQMMEIYKDRVDFLQWFADMDLKDVIDLTVRDVVDFIVSSLEEHETVGQ